MRQLKGSDWHEEIGVFTMPMENLWKRVKRWAKRNGKEYSCHNVQGVAPL